jgi:hypothetical protein
MIRAFQYLILGVATAVLLTGCHFAGHLPPGQVKQVIDPAPGHGVVPPGQLKKM